MQRSVAGIVLAGVLGGGMHDGGMTAQTTPPSPPVARLNFPFGDHLWASVDSVRVGLVVSGEVNLTVIGRMPTGCGPVHVPDVIIDPDLHTITLHVESERSSRGCFTDEGRYFKAVKITQM